MFFEALLYEGLAIAIDGKEFNIRSRANYLFKGSAGNHEVSAIRMDIRVLVVEKNQTVFGIEQGHAMRHAFDDIAQTPIKPLGLSA